MPPDPDSAGAADSAARLEVALERIARLAHAPGPGPQPGGNVAVAERLDRIIARLHRALEDGA